MNIPQLKIDHALAFKKLLAQTCGLALTVAPAVGLSTLGVLTLNAVDDSVKTALSVAFGGGSTVIQVMLIGMKLEADNRPLNAAYWREKIVNFEISLRKKEINKHFFSIRHLKTVKLDHPFKPSDYQGVAKTLLFTHVDKLNFFLWKAQMTRLSENFLFDPIFRDLNSLHEDAVNISKKMDDKTLKSHIDGLLKKRFSNHSHKTLFKYLTFTPHSEHISDAHKDHIHNARVYERAHFLMDSGIIGKLIESDYQNFARTVKSGQHNPQKLIEPFIEFLNTYPECVNWGKISALFNKNFNNAWYHNQTEFYHATMTHLLSQEVKYSTQSAPDQNTATIKEDQQPLTTLLKPPLNSTDHDDRVGSCLELVNYPNAHFFSDKWLDLKTNYDVVIQHKAQIPKDDYQELHNVLNASLSMIRLSDQNLAQLTHLNTEDNRALLGRNLDLAIEHVKKAVTLIGADVIQNLRATEKYQTMKMNKK